MTNERLPLLGKAEQLCFDIPYEGTGRDKPPVWTYEEAKSHILPQLETAIEEIKEIPNNKKINSGIYFTVDLDFSFIAKSYYPKSFFEKCGWELQGSIAFTQSTRGKSVLTSPKTSRKLFFRAHPENIEKTYLALRGDNISTETDKLAIQKIHGIGLHSIKEKTISLPQAQETSILELIIHPMLSTEWVEFIEVLKSALTTPEYPTSLFNWQMGAHLGGPRFLPIQANTTTASEIASYNPVRAIRPMPEISFPRMATNGHANGLHLPPAIDLRAEPHPYIGVFDGGVDLAIPQLAPWVVQTDLTNQPAEQFALEHGTAVCGAALYGDKPHSTATQPQFKVKSFRVFPSPMPDGKRELGLYAVLSLIEEAVRSPENSTIKTYVLSFGPRKPIDDHEVDLFTSTLDRLSFEFDILFVVAAGNDGELASPQNRIQPPADIVNGLGVGAFIKTEDNKHTKANYSCPGPGRSGNAVKPDIHMFGGDTPQKFCVFKAGGNGACTYTQGTSFSAPLAGNIAGNLLYRVDDHENITPQTAKALMIHKAFKYDNWKPEWGWGALDFDIDAIMSCSKNSVTLLYNGELPITRRTILPIPFPHNAIGTSSSRIAWTLVYSTDISPSMPDEYTLGGASLTFRPHNDIFTYQVNEKTHTINRATHPDQYEQMISRNIIKKEKLPKSSSPNKRDVFLTEEERRKFGVWDTARHYWTGWKRHTSLYKPIIDIHAQARSDWHFDKFRPTKIRYACVVTIETKTNIDIYTEVRNMAPVLTPVRLRATARTRT